MQGQTFNNCNCAWGCPCQFNALPTQGDCYFVIGMQIEMGHFGDVSLDGLRWVAIASYPGAIHEGNGTWQAVIDERADKAQREALDTLLRGEEAEPGTTMLQVYNSMVATRFETLYKPIEIEIDVEKRTGRIMVTGLVNSVGEPIRNPVTGEAHRVRIDMTDGFEYELAEMGSASSSVNGRFNFELNESYSQFANVDLTQNGVVRHRA
jgi:hypothetical protein